MKSIRCVFVVCTACLWMAPMAATAEDLAAVEKVIKEKWSAVKSFRGKMHTTMAMEMEGYKSKTESKGTYELVRVGEEKYKMRMESKGTSETTMGEQTTKSTSESLMVMDGEYMYSYSVTDGEKSAMKSKMDDDDYGNLDPFVGMKETSDLSLLPEEEVDGQACYVVQATPKDQASMGPMGKTVMYIRKDCGMTVKMIGYTVDGKPMNTNTFSDIEINPSIGDDRFVFKAPEGVEVVDMSAMMEQAEAQYDEDEDEDDEP